MYITTLPVFTSASPTSYWTMNFDASPKTVAGLSALMQHDLRVIRWSNIKLGEKIEDIVKPPAKTIKQL
jgi:small subunit ribosomal protein S6